MVFFSAVFAARAPAMGNSADRAWQLSQLVEGVSTAFNPSHGSLSCAFPNLRCCPRCWLFSCLGVYFHLRISPKEHQKERCGHFSVAALLHYVLWCASEYSVVGRISCYVSHDSIGTNVCQRSFADFFFANCKCKLDTRMDKKCSAEAGLGCLAASTAGAVKDAAGKAEPVP